MSTPRDRDHFGGLQEALHSRPFEFLKCLRFYEKCDDVRERLSHLRFDLSNTHLYFSGTETVVEFDAERHQDRLRWPRDSDE